MARAFDIKTQEKYRKIEDERCCTLYVNDPRVFGAEKILDIRAITTEIEYSIKWTGYDASYNEWVAERDVTPDLKRAFSQEKKKKEIKSWKDAKAKARALRRRKKNGPIARSSTIGLTSTPLGVSPTRRNTNVPLRILAESDPQIPEWITPTEEDEEEHKQIDTSMSVTSSSDESKPKASVGTTSIKWSQETGTSPLSTVLSMDQSELEIPERNILPEEKAVDNENGEPVCAGLMRESTVRSNGQASDQSSCPSFRLIAESESDSEIDSFTNTHEPGGYLLGFNELLEPVFIHV